MTLQDHTRLRQALLSLRPGANFILAGDTYAALMWDPANAQAKPSEAEVNAEIDRLNAAEDASIARLNDVALDAQVADTIQKLKTSTLTQMNTFIDNQLTGTTVAQLRTQSVALHKRTFAVLMFLAKQLP
jgi:hypothetical protein